MAFTDEQKTRLRFYLGYPHPYQYLNPRLESAFTVIGDSAPAQALVEQLLALIGVVFGNQAGDPAQVQKALQQAGIQEVEDNLSRVKFGDSGGGVKSFSSAQLNSVADYGRILVGALSSFVGVPIASDVFGRSGYQGDPWMTAGQRSLRNFSW